MQYLSADIIFPVSGGPRRESVLVLTDEGVVEGIFTLEELQHKRHEIRFYKGMLCPGFVNTHCHLELSWAKGMIDEGKGLDSFVRQLELNTFVNLYHCPSLIAEVLLNNFSLGSVAVQSSFLSAILPALQHSSCQSKR